MHKIMQMDTPEEIGEHDNSEVDVTKILEKCDFSKDAQIMVIRPSDFRMLCYFLEIESPKDVQRVAHKDVALLSMILMQAVPSFMESRGYKKVGQLDFNSEGELAPCGTSSWSIKGEEVSFITSGFLYFEKEDDKAVFHIFLDTNNGVGLITVYHESEEVTKGLMADLNIYAKQCNCLKGAKIGDIDMYQGTFKEIISSDTHTWENYYYEDSVKDLFELEVFGFLNNVEEYNAAGITKRGIMLHGRPGTGKTTVGHIICNAAPDHTVIWITPELVRSNSSSSINVLYTLADYVTPAIVILEDLDLFAEDREGVTDSLRLGALMNILDGVNSIKNSVTVATTNRIKLIEQALSNRPGRFDRKVEIDALSDELRIKMYKSRLEAFDIDDEVMETIVSRSENWSGAEIQELINTINLYFIKHHIAVKAITNDIADAVFEMMNNFGAIKHSKAISV